MPGFKVKLKEGGKIREGLTCSYCELVLRDPVQTSESGQRFCKSCFKDAVRDSNSGVNAHDKTWPDHAVKREISTLVVLCENEESGCEWEGHLKDLQDHLIKCQYVTVECRNRGCGRRVLLSWLERHLKEECSQRLVECPDCREDFHYESLAVHRSICPNALVACDNCKQQMPKLQLANHMTYECTWIKCLCGGEETTSSDLLYELGSAKLHDHLQDTAKLADHLQPLVGQFAKMSQCFQEMAGAFQMATNKIELLEHKTTTLEQQNEALQRDNADLRRTMNQLTSVEENNRKNSAQAGEILYESRLSLLEGNYAKLSGEMARNNDTVIQTASKVEGYIDQVDQIKMTQLSPQMSSTGREFAPHDGHLPSHDFVKQLEEKTLEVERTVNVLSVHHSELELQLQASLASTHTGAFLWRIPDVRRRIRDAKIGRITSIYSPPFYTGRNGYKMCIRAYLNGDGKGEGTHLSIFFVLMKGEYDPLLQWPFEHKVSLILVDQDHKKHMVQTFKPNTQSSSFQKPHADMNVASGCPEFTDLSIFDNTSYVKDDVMYIKAIVDTSKILHP